MSAAPPRWEQRLAAALLRLYPQAWRERYGTELREVLMQHRVRLRTLGDLIFGAIDAHLHPALVARKEPTVTRRIRTSQFVISCAAAFYAAALISLHQIRDPQAGWLRAVVAHPQLRSGLIAVQLTGGLAVAAGLAGFALITAVMMRQAARSPGRLRQALRHAGILLLAWLAVTAVTAAVTASRPGTGVRPLRPLDMGLETIWLATTAVAILLGAALLWRALASTELTQAAVRSSRIVAAVAAAAMAAGLIATITEASLLRAYAPALIGTGWLAVITAAMLATTAAATLAVARMGQHPPRQPARLAA